MDQSQELKKEVDDLEAKKHEWYEEAMEGGILHKITQVARAKGTRLSHHYGPKFMLIADEIEVYVDDYGGYMNVHRNGELLCSTHKCSPMFQPGPWVDVILRLLPEVIDEEAKKLIATLSKKRDDMRLSLGLVDTSDPRIKHWTHKEIWDLYALSKDLLSEVAMNENGGRKREQEEARNALSQLVLKLERKV